MNMHFSIIRGLILSLCLLMLSPLGLAQASPQILILVSQRNAELIADAAHIVKEKHPEATILARTDSQIWEMDHQEAIKLADASDLIIGIGLYGPTVADLENILAYNRNTIFMFQSEQRVVQLSRANGRAIFANSAEVDQLGADIPSKGFDKELDKLQHQFPEKTAWLTARRYWQAGGGENVANLMRWALAYSGLDISYQAPMEIPRLRWQYQEKMTDSLPAIQSDKPVIAIIDHGGSDNPTDNRILKAICQQAEQQYQHECIAAMAYWGGASVEAIESLKQLKNPLSAIIMMQDFVMGGGDGREQVSDILKELNVPVIKAIKQRDRTELEHLLSSDGIAFDKIYYQIAMPELQGASQPLIVANAGDKGVDELTGIKIQTIKPAADGIELILSRISKWRYLQTAANKDKRVALIYYNHPPGRHNIGADNLDVPASLWEILQRLKKEGYDTGKLPANEKELLDIIQDHAVNLPNDAGALADMSKNVQRVNQQNYGAWFKKLPNTIQREMIDGPLGLLDEQLSIALKASKAELAEQSFRQTLDEVRHLLEGVDHPARSRALALTSQLAACYQNVLSNDHSECLKDSRSIIDALRKTGIEGLSGWGEIPGRVMTYQGNMLLPGHQFGNVFIGPQPPRGWEVDEELLHANLAFPPPHQYLAFYYYLQEEFKADVLVHLGRHSTYEFLPRRATGLAEDDYSRIIASDIPGVYPYIVDGVGEGIQAKRRALAVMVDHMTPPLEHTPLYDDLLKLRQLIESFEASQNTNQATAKRLIEQIRQTVDDLELREELTASMADELEVRGIGLEEVDDDLLVHEVGHYLTKLQERFMPMGLHIFGKNWSQDAVTMMLASMKPENAKEKADWSALLKQSPEAEMQGLLKGLAGEFIVPGPGNDPVRSPDSLPTGRNFYALDNTLIPSPIAWEIGVEMASEARSKNPQNSDKSEALVLWASDVVRDEGVMIAFGLDMLGLKPVWNSRGIVKGIERLPLDKKRVRRDVVFTTSGLFRDLYSMQMILLNQAVLMALDGSAKTIQRDYPALTLALKNALKPLHESEVYLNHQSGSESLAQNQVAARWVKQAQKLLASGNTEADAGVMASLRVFGNPPGSYSTGVARLTERSGAWEHREEIAKVYLRRLGHSYGSNGFGVPAQELFRDALEHVENTYVGRSSNIYGLLDRNDVFDFLGGLSLAVETITGEAPNNFIINNSDSNALSIDPLAVALRSELRGRFLNPEWLKGLMKHNYAGARTMGSEFLEYLWGWQVTNPTLVGDWAWQEVKEVYIDDRYDLDLDSFLEDGHNVHVKSNMLAIMLVAIHKGFWNADDTTREQVADDFARLVIENGLPGSGHTTPNHPMLPWLQQYLEADKWEKLAAVIDQAKTEKEQRDEQHRITELDVQDVEKLQQTQSNSNENSEKQPLYSQIYYLLGLIIFTLLAGFVFNLVRNKPAE